MTSSRQQKKASPAKERRLVRSSQFHFATTAIITQGSFGLSICHLWKHQLNIRGMLTTTLKNKKPATG